MKRPIHVHTTISAETERQLDVLVWHLSEPWRQASRADAIAFAVGLVAEAVERQHEEAPDEETETTR